MIETWTLVIILFFLRLFYICLKKLWDKKFESYLEKSNNMIDQKLEVILLQLYTCLNKPKDMKFVIGL